MYQPSWLKPIRNKELGSLTTKFGPILEIDENPNKDKH